MCYNCGCGMPDDDMGSIDNITNQTFVNLAKIAHIPKDKIKPVIFAYLDKQRTGKLAEKDKDTRIEEMFTKAAQAWGQSVDDAKKQTYNLLSNELQDDVY